MAYMCRYYGSGSYVPGKGVAFYGGFEQSVLYNVVSNPFIWHSLYFRFTNPNWTTPNTNASRFFFSSNRKTGYTQVAYFNIDNPSVSVKLSKIIYNARTKPLTIPAVYLEYSFDVDNPFGSFPCQTSIRIWSHHQYAPLYGRRIQDPYVGWTDSS